MDKLISLLSVANWTSVIFHTLRFAGIATLFYLMWKNSKLLRVDWNVLSKFLAFMIFVTCVRFAALDFGIIPLPSLPALSFKDFIMVFWEDIVFAMSIYYLKDYKKFSKKIWIPATVLLSIGFMAGHLYYGWFAIVALTVPYFIMYHYGKKNGFGTQMIAHIMYDFIGIISMKLYTLMIYGIIF